MNLSETVRRTQTERAAAATRITDNAERENRSLSLTERTEFDAALTDVTELGARIRELEADEAAATRSASARLESGEQLLNRTGPSGWRVGAEAPTYSRAADSPSFIHDLYNSRQGDYDAAKRLQRNQAERDIQTRALGNTGASGGSGGEFSPPSWLIDEAVMVARAGRVAADRMTKEPLPSGVSSVNIPKLNSPGTATAIQSTQNTIVASVDPTTTYLSSGITTVAGSNVLSLQLVQQSAGPGFDKVVLMDLAADLARTVDRQVLYGTGTGGQVLGLLNVNGITQVPYTAASPNVGGLYSKINGAIAAVASNRFLPPDGILLTPARWAWICASTDSSGRPLVVPSGNAFNAIADPSTIAAQGPVGQMAGLPVYTDANLPLNAAGQDPIVVARFADLFLWESDVTLATFDAPYSQSLGILVRAHCFLAAIMSRQPSAIAVVQGTGTSVPTF